METDKQGQAVADPVSLTQRPLSVFNMKHFFLKLAPVQQPHTSAGKPALASTHLVSKAMGMTVLHIAHHLQWPFPRNRDREISQHKCH